MASLARRHVIYRRYVDAKIKGFYVNAYGDKDTAIAKRIAGKHFYDENYVYIFLKTKDHYLLLIYGGKKKFFCTFLKAFKKILKRGLIGASYARNIILD
jgi:hypothetical protein